MNDLTQQSNGVLGNTATVEFSSFGNRSCEGKVDTGATTSSLHATDIRVNQQRKSVSFRSDAISDKVITLPLAGVQEVHSADAGGVPRPVINLDVTVDGKPMEGVAFNLNDRTNMDSKILIGQNILQAGQFTIDPNKDSGKVDSATATLSSTPTNEAAVLQAFDVLIENNVTLSQLVMYLQTAAITRIRD